MPIILSDYFENGITEDTLKGLVAFWVTIYIEGNFESVEHFESALPEDSDFFRYVKSSESKYGSFLSHLGK